jgi:hypothetical protein
MCIQWRKLIRRNRRNCKQQSKTSCTCTGCVHPGETCALCQDSTVRRKLQHFGASSRIFPLFTPPTTQHNQTTHDQRLTFLPSTTFTHIQYRQYAFDVHSRYPGQACLHLEEGHWRRGHKVRTPCSLLARRQVLEVRFRFSSLARQCKRRNQKGKEGPNNSRRCCK